MSDEINIKEDVRILMEFTIPKFKAIISDFEKAYQNDDVTALQYPHLNELREQLNQTKVTLNVK